jgi:hypothetical protein
MIAILERRKANVVGDEKREVAWRELWGVVV